MIYEKRDRRLWHRLEGYSFHERPLSRSLVEQLEEATGHSVDVCYTMVEEYRRFMYLLGSTDADISPSPIVDQVWELHVADKKAYYDDFCPRVLGRTIHRPDDLPTIEDDPAYLMTLDAYTQEFGLPLVQYWPDPDRGTMRLARMLMWSVAVAAFALSVIFNTIVFALFGALVLTGTMFLQWKYSAMPLRNDKLKDD